MNAVIEKPILKEFFNFFGEKADSSVLGYWGLKRSMPHGELDRIDFHGSYIILQKTHAEDLPFMLLVAITKEQRIYKHAAYMLTMFAHYHFLNNPDSTELKIKTYGNAYQACLLVNSYHVDAVSLSGTVERVDRFGNSSEKEINKITSVVLTRKEQK